MEPPKATLADVTLNACSKACTENEKVLELYDNAATVAKIRMLIGIYCEAYVSGRAVRVIRVRPARAAVRTACRIRYVDYPDKAETVNKANPSALPFCQRRAAHSGPSSSRSVCQWRDCVQHLTPLSDCHNTN